MRRKKSLVFRFRLYVLRLKYGKARISKLVVVSSLVGIVASWIAYFFVVSYSISNTETQGQFGDMYGALNTLFSGFAFAMLIYSAWMQKEELALQRKELDLTRTELRGQKLEMATQNVFFLEQKNETTFFELLKFHSQIVESTTALIGGVRREGRRCYPDFYNSFKRRYAQTPLPSGVSQEAHVVGVYVQFYDGFQESLGHYFRNLYHALKFVHFSNLVEKKRYADILRAQLSSSELVLIFYNCLSFHGREKFYPLSVEYSLFKNMPKDMLMHHEHENLYPSKAFGRI